MADVALKLSEELQQFVDAEVEAGGYATASDYIEALIARAKQGKEKVESLLIEGLDSGDPAPLDADLWNSIRTDVDGHTGI